MIAVLLHVTIPLVFSFSCLRDIFHFMGIYFDLKAQPLMCNVILQNGIRMSARPSVGLQNALVCTVPTDFSVRFDC